MSNVNNKFVLTYVMLLMKNNLYLDMVLFGHIYDWLNAIAFDIEHQPSLKVASSSPTELVKLIQRDTFIEALSSMSGTLRVWGDNNYRHFVDSISKVWVVW